jgi:hypothetical protein
MPGITQTRQREQVAVFSREDHTPDCILVIDSSASMVNPSHRLSHAVPGAGCACDACLRNGAAGVDPSFRHLKFSLHHI